MKIKLIVDDIPLQKVNNFCINNNLELDTNDMSITIYERRKK